MSKEVAIIRSRFQPFTIFHKKIIEECLKKNWDVVLCIIREHEAISRFYRVTPQVGALDLRHLPIFNPLTIWDVVLHINRCLEKSKLEKNIPIIFSPLKFPELVSVITRFEGSNIPSSINDFVEYNHPCTSEIFERCNAINWLSKLIPIIVSDTIPEEVTWVIGLFDVEDKSDFERAKTRLTAQIVDIANITGNRPIYSPEGLNPPMQLGLYGAFCFWIYLQFINHFQKSDKFNQYPSKIPEALRRFEFLEKQIKSLGDILKDWMIDSEWEFFETRASQLIYDLLNRIGNIPEAERNILLNFYNFIEYANTSIKAYGTT